jgi:hypothetical protein
MVKRKRETSPSGAPIYRYEASNEDWQAVHPEDTNVEQIEQHIRKYVGDFETVYHEIASDLVHIDVYFVEPSPERDFRTLITSGMSSRPMQAPQGAEECRFAELMICLPPDWPLNQSDLKDESNYWPIRALKFLARFPHKYDTWIWWGHTIPNGDPPQPFADNTGLCGVILAAPILQPDEFFTLEVNEDKTIHFFSLLPLYLEEMDFKLRKGVDELFDLLDRHRVTTLVDLERPNVCRKTRRLFRFKS